MYAIAFPGIPSSPKGRTLHISTTAPALRCTIVVPAYNAARYIEATLHSVLAQSVSAWETARGGRRLHGRYPRARASRWTTAGCGLSRRPTKGPSAAPL
ncbi:MAG: glycosyltransferase family 2 protein, partial [Candidatus Competibacteraceae bacterium]|nr:glycosyltransferase family 2 protein [Candidatus Competibacteraceae bacterium]